MANREKGEVEFKAGKDDHVMSFSADAICEIESALGKNLDQIIKMLQVPENIKLADMRIMFWKGLADQKPDLTFDDARAVARKINSVEMALLVGKAFVLSMPADDAAAPANPPAPDSQKPGTGPAS